MRLVWVVLPLIILGIIEISESFAEEKISAHIEGGELLNIKKIDELDSVNFEINTQNQGGSVAIELPKSVWHIADSECNPISPIILVDGKETTFTDYFEKNNRVITINAVKGAKIIELIVTGPAAPHTTSLMYGQFCFLQEQDIFLPPKKQLELGFMPYDVQCKDTLVKMIKNYNNLPVCVYPKTAEKLIERGWHTFIIIIVDKEKYEIGDNITITVKNIGTKKAMFPGGPPLFGIKNSKNEVICCSGPEGIFTLSPNEESKYTWNQLDYVTSKYVESGNYQIFTHFWTEPQTKINEAIHWIEITKS